MSVDCASDHFSVAALTGAVAASNNVGGCLSVAVQAGKQFKGGANRPRSSSNRERCHAHINNLESL